MQDETTVQAVQEGEVVTRLPEEPVQEVASAQAELEQVKGERDQLLDRLARLQAEFDNARKREAKERQDVARLHGFEYRRTVSGCDGQLPARAEVGRIG